MADGEVIVAVGNDRQFARLCAILGLPELAEDERFRTNPARVVNRAELIPILQSAMLKRGRAEFSEALEAAGIPAGADQPGRCGVRRSAGRIQSMRLDGPVPGLASPIVIDGRRQVADRRSPGLDDDRDALFGS